MFRHPDIPCGSISRDMLATLNAADWVAQYKYDGWRTQIHYDGTKCTYTSRHNKPIPITPECSLPFEKELYKSAIPPNTIYDAEWIGRRGGNVQHLVIFDVLLWQGKPLWKERAVDRIDRLNDMFSTTCFVVPRYFGLGISLTEFYDKAHNIHASPDSDVEGIVLKRNESTYIGSVRNSAKNSGWLKCKWRGGEDGKTLMMERRL